MLLEGNIREFSLPDLLTMVADSGVTGLLEIGAHPHAGRIFCRDGGIYHVELRQHSDYDALHQLLECEDAPFRFVAGVQHTTETFWSDRQALIGFLRRHEQLYRRMRRHIPSLDWIPVLCTFSSDTCVRLSAAIWPVLAAIDGQRSVAEIAALIGQEPLEIGVAIGDLIARGLANIKPPRAALPQAAPAPSAPARRTGGRFFEWLLMGKTDARPAGILVK